MRWTVDRKNTSSVGVTAAVAAENEKHNYSHWGLVVAALSTQRKLAATTAELKDAQQSPMELSVLRIAAALSELCKKSLSLAQVPVPTATRGLFFLMNDLLAVGLVEHLKVFFIMTSNSQYYVVLTNLDGHNTVQNDLFE